MSCRCSDIWNCKEDIEVIGDIISDISGAQTLENSISDSGENLAAFCRLTFIVDSITDFTKKIKNLNEYELKAIPNMMSTCNCQVNGLHSQLRSMQSEDTWHHEELARQERESQERQREESKKAEKESRKK